MKQLKDGEDERAIRKRMGGWGGGKLSVVRGLEEEEGGGRGGCGGFLGWSGDSR